MSDRRQFLSAVAAAGLWRAFEIPPPTGTAPRVEASPTVFYAHPVGETTLIRFSAHDTNAPAGRMRVYDASGRRLLGTAGVLGVQGTLFGELWLPIRSETRIISELEIPGLARPLRTPHVVTPQPRWTVHWVTVTDPHRLALELDSLPTWRRSAAIAQIKALHVSANPVSAGNEPWETGDHLSLLRRAIPARDVARRFGIATSPIAVGEAADFATSASILSLTESGVGLVALSGNGAGTVRSLTARDGAAVHALLMMRSTSPADLGFASGGDVMAREIEQWLQSAMARRPSSSPINSALVVGTDVDEDLLDMADAVEAWNTRFAFPRIVVGGAEAFFENALGDAIAHRDSVVARGESPSPAEILRASAQRADDRKDRVHDILTPLLGVLGSTAAGLPGLAEHLHVMSDGLVVFNSSPVARSDIVRLPDGSEQLVTDVPALGYAYIPRVGSNDAPYVQPGPHSAFGQLMTVRLDDETGAVSSLYHRADEREWVRRGTPGINAVTGSVLERVTRWRLPGVGMRLIADRRTPLGALRSTVTTYTALPWIDVTNEVLDGPAGATQRYDFYLDADDPLVTRETPAGFEDVPTPHSPVPHLRWLRLVTPENWQVLFRGIDAPYTACDTNGHLVSLAPANLTRYRIKIASPFAPPDEPWHFGWSTDPLTFVPITATAREESRLPRYGSLLTLDQPGVAVLGVKGADNGDGAIVYLQDLIGAERDVAVRGGILGFRSARRVDVTERHHEELPVTSEPAVRVHVRAEGIAVVRLLDLYLRGG